MTKPTITLQPNGPLRVEGLTHLLNSRGESVPTKRVVSLCRCGASKNKPFCDGTHKSIGWTDAKSPDRVPDRLDEYSGRDATILDNRGTCAHAGFCTSGLPSVWRSGVEPWIDPDGAPGADITATIRRCPSGALAYVEKAKPVTVFSDDPAFQVTRDGPFVVRGGIRLEGVDKGAGASDEHYALCRCGGSRNKPFCDGTHWYAGFKDDEGVTISTANRAGDVGEDAWMRVGRETDFAPDTVHAVSVGRHAVALVREGELWHALDGRCPHQGGPLTEGALCEGKLRCPWHGYDFALKDGKGVGNDDAVDTYAVRVVEGSVEIAVPAPKRSSWTVSHVVVETMATWGIDTVFGMVGHSNLGLAEAIRIQEERGAMRFIGVRHEGAAAFACSGYAKVSGRPAACLSIAGPGATNLLTGLWDAKVDRVPVLALTGQVQMQVMGPGAFQDIDLASAFEAVARFSQSVLPGSDPAELTSLALKTAIVERDVAHLVFPDDVQTLDAGKAAPGRREGRIGDTRISPPRHSVDLVNARIARARRPVVIVGAGAREGVEEVLRLADALHAPVLTTFKAKGLVSDHHPLGAGVLGRSGTPVASWFMNESDLLIVFGASFSHHTGIAATKPIVQVDFDRMQLGKFHRVDEAVWGDIAETAARLREGIGGGSGRVDQRAELAERWAAWRAEKASREKQDRGKGLNSAIVFKHLAAAVDPDAVLSVDVGNNTYSFGRYFECERQQVLMSGYLGSIGFAFPAAMGAWAAAPDRQIVSVSGDGGFGQYLAEFTTAVKYGMNVTHVLLDNGELGKISKEQRDGDWAVWQTSLRNPDFAEYARLCGGHGVRVTSGETLPAALDEALRHPGPSLVDVLTDAELT